MQIKDLMTRDVVTVDVRATAADVAKIMTQRNVGSVIVVENGKRLTGLVTDRDIVTDVVGKGQNATDVTVEQIMTKDPVCLREGQHLVEALEMISQTGYRRLPVVDANDNVIGILSVADVAAYAEEFSKAVFREVSKSVKEAKVQQPEEKKKLLPTFKQR